MSAKEVLEAVRTLTPEEREHLRALLATPPGDPSSPEEEAQARLRAAGLLGETHSPSAAGRGRRTPVEIKGKPLSETIVEDRR